MPAATAALQFDAARFEHEATQKLLCLTRFRPNIEFDREGTIFSASDLFTEMMGYSTEELLGQRHGIFVDATECNYGQQNDFWAKLCSGTPQTGEYKRLAKGGRQLWLASTY